MKTQYLKFTIIALACFLCGSIVNAIKIEIPKELKDDLEAQKAADKAALEEKLEQSEVQSQESPNGGQMSFGAGENQGQSGDTDASTGEDGQSANDGQLETFTFDAGNLEEGEGRIAGQIFDKDTGQPLRGVAILIEGTDIGTITDSQGRYRLNNVQSGEYTLSIVKSGYIEATVTETKVTEGELMKLDFALPPRPAEMSDEVYVLEGLTVTAAEAISQNVALLALRQTSIASIDALSSEDFSKFAASDVAEAVTRISGASLSDGKYIVVRGLNDRYNTVLINGVRLPSPDPDRKAVALDIFPTSLIDSIVARKTYTSDMPGESSGGSVEMRTKSIPDEPFIKFSFSAGGQYTSSDTDTFLADPEQIGLLDWLQGDDNRGYSVSDQDDTLLSNYPNTVGNQNFPLMAPVRKGMNKFGDRSYSLSFGGSKRFSDWFSVGAIFGTKVSEKKRSSFKELNRITFESGNAVLSQTALKEDGQGILKGEEEYSASVLLGLGFEIADHTTINYNYFNTASLTSTAEISSYSQFITDAGQANGQNIPDGINIFNDFEVGSEERSLEAHQFSGEHRFENVVFDSDWVFSWYYTEAAMEQSEPDQRQISEYFTEFEGFSTNPGLPPVARYQRDTEQESQMYGIDLQQTYEIGDFATFNLHIGFDQEESERMFQQLETLGGNTVQEPLYMALPAPDGARGFIGQVFEESILGRNGADGQDGIDAVIRSLYDSRIEPLPGRISARQADLVSLESALSAAESLFSTTESELNSAIAGWDASPSYGGAGFTFDPATGLIFDPGTGEFKEPSFFSDPNVFPDIFDAYSFFLETQFNNFSNARDDVEDVNSEVEEVQGLIELFTGNLNTLTAEREAYIEQAIAFENLLRTMPVMASDPSSYPTFSFFGDENYILSTPLGFAVYADEFAESAPRIGNVEALFDARGENKVSSFFASGVVEFTDPMLVNKVRIAGGFRHESTQLSYNLMPNREITDGVRQPVATSSAILGFSPGVVEPAPIDQTDLTYYAAVIVDVNDFTKVSFSRSVTIAKPTFREIAPFPIFNLSDRSVEIGNAGLTEIVAGAEEPRYILPPEFAGLDIAGVESVDFRIEFYTPNDGLLSFGVFKKEIENPIERVQALQINSVDINTFINNDNTADLEGWEVEVQQNLGFLEDRISWLPLSWVTIGGNFTKLDAEVQRSTFEMQNLTGARFGGGTTNLIDPDVYQVGGASAMRPLYDQPEYVANAFISLAIEPTGTTITLSQNWVGDQLNRAGGISGSQEGSSDLYWAAFSSMSLVVEQSFGDHWKLKFSAKNIDSPVREMYESREFIDNLTDPQLFEQSGGNAIAPTAVSPFRTRQTIEPTYSISLSGSF